MEKRSEDWRKKSHELRQYYGIPLGARPWTSKPGVRLAGVVANDRVRDLIDIAWAVCSDGLEGDDLESVRKALIVDYSQDVGRKPWSMTIGTFTTSSCIYSYGKDAKIREQEKFFMCGFDQSTDFGDIAESALRDLVGDCMALPCVGAVVASAAVGAELPRLWSESSAPPC